MKIWDTIFELARGDILSFPIFMKVSIMGLGSYKQGSGISAAKFFIARGDEVLITDLKNEKDLAHQVAELKNFCKKNKKSAPKFVLGRHDEKDFADADLVMRNPGVPKDSPYLKIAREHGAEIETDISIFMKNCPAQIVGVTGTRGKSTTATLIYEILKTKFGRVWLGGNIKISPLSFIDKIKSGDVVVLELSSWLLENFRDKKIAPHIAVVTNIYPDHLNTYKNMAEYVVAKKNIFACQAAEDYLIANGENAETKKWRGPGKTIYFFKKDARGLKINLLGEHNLENIAAALAAAKIFKILDAAVKKVLRNFRGLPDRQEFIAEIRGVKYINDTTATSPDGAMAALKTFGTGKKNIILIAGGKDKELEYGKLAKEIKKYCKAVILFPGTATEKIKSMLHATCYMLQDAKNMPEAVHLAKNSAVRGDIVLLSPAAASFGLFKNEFERGGQFKKAVKKRAKRSPVVKRSFYYRGEFDRGEKFKAAVKSIK